MIPDAPQQNEKMTEEGSEAVDGFDLLESSGEVSDGTEAAEAEAAGSSSEEAVAIDAVVPAKRWSLNKLPSLSPRSNRNRHQPSWLMKRRKKQASSPSRVSSKDRMNSFPQSTPRAKNFLL